MFLLLTIAFLLCLTACHKHNFVLLDTDWTYTNYPPTCDREGRQQLICSECGAFGDFQIIMPIGHK